MGLLRINYARIYSSIVRRVQRQEAEFSSREAVLRQAQQDVDKARDAIDEEVAKKLKAERASISDIEARKARGALANELEQRDKQLAELQQIINTNSAKLAEEQQAQADVPRKQRELDDARRELNLDVEKKVQESLVTEVARRHGIATSLVFTWRRRARLATVASAGDL